MHTFTTTFIIITLYRAHEAVLDTHWSSPPSVSHLTCPWCVSVKVKWWMIGKKATMQEKTLAMKTFSWFAMKSSQSANVFCYTKMTLGRVLPPKSCALWYQYLICYRKDFFKHWLYEAGGDHLWSFKYNLNLIPDLQNNYIIIMSLQKYYVIIKILYNYNVIIEIYNYDVITH